MANWTMRKRLVGSGVAIGLAVALLGGAGTAEAQLGRPGAAAPVTYTNHWEMFGGITFADFQAGQAIPERMNLGGVEFNGTRWLTGRWGATVDFRGDAGTTEILPNPYEKNRALVYREAIMGGGQMRWLKNQYAAVNLHAFGGVSHGNFEEGIVAAPQEVGLYTNRTKPYVALGGSLDFNRTAYLAIRLSPDLILEDYGTELREYFGLSGGVVYRFGQRAKKKK